MSGLFPVTGSFSAGAGQHGISQSPARGWLPFLNVLGVVLWILLMVKAYQGERYRLPVIGDLAEEWCEKVDL